MSTASTLLPLVFLGALAIGGYIFIEKLKAAKQQTDDVSEDSTLSCKAKDPLTPNELEFLGRLEAAVPELRVCPQMAMGALLEPAVSKKENGKKYMATRGTFQQKVTDFVAMDRKTGAVVAIIELDDKTHNKAKDAKRDAMLRSAGYKTVRWDSRNKPDTAAIRKELLGAS